MNTAPFIKTIVLQSSGAEAFSYGHNMRAVRRALLENNDRQYVSKQFREVSKLAYYIATCETPVITILNGSVFGSGAGVGCFADYVISNPGTKFATPEVSYGYMPDAGNIFLLKKVDQKFPGLGMFLGLTGAQIKGTDLIQCGISTHIGMPGAASLIMENFAGEYEKSQTRTKLHDAVMHAVENDKMMWSEPLSFAQDLPAIERCFHGRSTVEQIVAELQSLADSVPDGKNVIAIEWAKRTLIALSRVSPLALKTAHRALYRAISEDLSLHACHNMEFRAGQHLVNSDDFKAGIDALVSGRAMPQSWPSGETIESIDDAIVEEFFIKPLVCCMLVMERCSVLILFTLPVNFNLDRHLKSMVPATWSFPWRSSWKTNCSEGLRSIEGSHLKDGGYLLGELFKYKVFLFFAPKIFGLNISVEQFLWSSYRCSSSTVNL